MRERGTSAARLMWIDGWGAKSFHSAFGLYGETSVSAAPLCVDGEQLSPDQWHEVLSGIRIEGLSAGAMGR